MGNCFNGHITPEERKKREDLKTEKKLNKKNEEILDNDMRAQAATIKILLLGTGDSGKSTIFKQIRECYGKKLTNEEIAAFRPLIYENINKSVKAVLRARNIFGIKLVTEELATRFEDIRYEDKVEITPQIAQTMMRLWEDPGTQLVWKQRSRFQVYENLSYYMDNMERISQGKNFIPNRTDILRCRVRTTGVTFLDFQHNGAAFQMYDVGGQKGERKNWIKMFDEVSTVLFVTAASEYDQTLFEDERTNRLEDSVKVFADVANREEFLDTSWALFINKWDLFEEKIKTHRFRDAERNINLDYLGKEPCDYDPDSHEHSRAKEQCAHYFQDKFINCMESRVSETFINCHYTTALDTKSITDALEESKVFVTQKIFEGAGFLPTPQRSQRQLVAGDLVYPELDKQNYEIQI